MFIVDVVPITKGILREKLTYFSAKDVSLGALVEIPLRKRVVKALVVSKKDAEDLKSSLRQSDYSVKKISSLKVKKFLPEEFIESAIEAGHFFASNTGIVLNNVIPKVILENFDKLNTYSPLAIDKDSHEKLLIQADDEERFSIYKRLIREEFAKNCSVLFIAPTLEDVKNSRELLNKGIENYTLCLSGDLKNKEILDLWNKILKEDHPLLVIGTPQFMCLPRHDFNIMILDREQSGAYKQLVRPYLDMRTFAEILSKKTKTRLLFGDAILRTETIWREKNLDFSDITPLKFRSVSSAVQSIGIIKKERGQEFSPISEELNVLLEKSLENKESLFLFGGRSGLSPIILCNDCGESIKCPKCSAPSVLHQDAKNRFLLCHKCGFRRKVNLKCESCQSWRLEPLGIGLELIEDEIKKRFPQALIIRIDKESANTRKLVQQKIAKFVETPGSVLIGTEMTIPYLRTQIDNVVCATIDSFFSIPDFRINEKVFSLLLRLRALSRKNFLIQTRIPSLKIWQNVLDGNLSEFYREEVEQRKHLNYPPFSILVKITMLGPKISVEREAEKLAEFFKEYDPQVYPSFISKVKGLYIMNALIKIPPNSWPDETILQKLQSLPPKFMVKIDPDNIL